MQIAIRQADAESVRSWLPLFLAYLDFYRTTQPAKACAAFLEQRLRKGEAVVFLAEDAAGVQGFALLYPGFSSLGLRPHWLLHDLFVSPASRGGGVGQLLLEHCQRHVAALGGGVTLQTAHDNLNAQRLYERSGFKLDTEFRVYEWSESSSSAPAAP
ncbi:GNAT family N-acetyltransferase [Chromobacterium haemolyticum]|uniref:GNAT family N-acetyltransferase n=1 Tax=Chromobacterium haemolyticum TaxID=394935 RepID=UPI002449D714|nr:GNAT family N-acetyltransferase [Chromobacterium haemolyticum]MDH0340079.1 GNAT family N-acetyltransferase [Chromobacterium haemolyticum]